MSLKKSFMSYVQDALKIPLMGIGSLDDYSQEDIDRIRGFIDLFAQTAPIPKSMKENLHPREMLREMKSIIVVAVPNYMEKTRSFSQCREGLLGTTSALHVTSELPGRAQEISAGVCSFFADRGHECSPMARDMFFPAKLTASRCGIGYYGKNSMILNPDYGSWLSLTGFMTDAFLESDGPLAGDCGDCDLCVRACPGNALHVPHQCDTTRCINFHLAHNKGVIPATARPGCSNLLAQACTVCKDVCPKNKGLKPLQDCKAPENLLHPSLLKILEMDETEWSDTFGKTLMGMVLRDKKYLKRNAVIALGNFKDERAEGPLVRQLENGDPEVRGYVPWALGRIGLRSSLDHFQAALEREKESWIRDEIISASELIENL